MINNPGKEKMVEKASDELSLRTLSSIKSITDLLSILHNLFGAIKGKMVMQIIITHDAKEKAGLIDKELRELMVNINLF